LRDAWSAPFFFEDSRYVFYVKPKFDWQKLPEHQDYGFMTSIKSETIHPFYYFEQPGKIPPTPESEFEIRYSPLHVVSGGQDTPQNITKVMRSPRLVTFNGKKIGVNGVSRRMF
jgi:hypothetical protein